MKSSLTTKTDNAFLGPSPVSGMVRFVTGNDGKVREARAYLDQPVKQFEYDYVEIQSPALTEIASAGAREAFEATDGDEPVFVEDSGLFVDALDGFPGPYSAYVEDTIGVEAIPRLVEEVDPARAWFRSIVACAYSDSADSEVAVDTFEGAVRGRIVQPRGEGGFGYDPIFEHDGKTMAEMTTEEKNAVSHRGRALAKVADWLAERE